MPEHGGWFFDSVTLSNFALSDSLEILAARYRGHWFATTQVLDELARGVAAGYAPLAKCLDMADRGILKAVALGRAERTLFRQLVAHLGEGEAGTISAASCRHGVAVTDDLAARRTYADIGVPVTGTIGILKAAIRDRAMSPAAANALLLRMVDAGFHSPVNRIT